MALCFFMQVALNCYVLGTLSPSGVGHMVFFCLLLLGVGGRESKFPTEIGSPCDNLKSPEQ